MIGAEKNDLLRSFSAAHTSHHLQCSREKFVIRFKVCRRGPGWAVPTNGWKMKTDKRRYYALARYSLLAISFSISITIVLIGMPKALLIR